MKLFKLSHDSTFMSFGFLLASLGQRICKKLDLVFIIFFEVKKFVETSFA